MAPHNSPAVPEASGSPGPPASHACLRPLDPSGTDQTVCPGAVLMGSAYPRLPRLALWPPLPLTSHLCHVSGHTSTTAGGERNSPGGVGRPAGVEVSMHTCVYPGLCREGRPVLWVPLLDNGSAGPSIRAGCHHGTSVRPGPGVGSAGLRTSGRGGEASGMCRHLEMSSGLTNEPR